MSGLELLQKFMTQDLADQLWNEALAEVKRIESRYPDKRGTSRSQAMYHSDGRGLTTLLSIGMPDGTTEVHQIVVCRPPAVRRSPTVHVQVSYHSSEPYWESQIASDPDRRVVVDGVHYRLGKNGGEPSPHNGMGGARYVVEFFDGRRVVTHDLWYQGPIPPKFRDHLPDNARFVREVS